MTTHGVKWWASWGVVLGITPILLGIWIAMRTGSQVIGFYAFLILQINFLFLYYLFFGRSSKIMNWLILWECMLGIICLGVWPFVLLFSMTRESAASLWTLLPLFVGPAMVILAVTVGVHIDFRKQNPKGDRT